jgi:hypothetical protein
MATMRIMFRVGIISLAVAGAYAPLDSRLVERWYSTSIYPAIQRTLTPALNLVPFAWFDVLTLGVLLIFLLGIGRVFRQARRGHGRRAVPRFVLGAVTAAAVFYVAFLAMWGLNYRRLPMEERLVIDRAAPSPDEVLRLGLMAAAQLNALHGAAHQEGWRTTPWRDRRMREAAATVQRTLSNAPPATPGRLKTSVYGLYFRWASVDGMINPLGLEVIGNPDLLPFERPFVAAHEWAHLAGYADESEASFVGFLTCVRARAPAAYSGWLFLFWQVNGEVDESARQRLSAALEKGPSDDVAAMAVRIRRGEVPMLRKRSWQIYDRYLRSNQVEEGIGSYGAVVTLLLRARFEPGWIPVRASRSGIPVSE